MGPVALVFFGIPAAFALVDGGLKGILAIRTHHKASKRVDEVGDEGTAVPPTVDDLDDDLLYPVTFDAVVPGSVLKDLHRSEVWKDLVRGAKRAELDKQAGGIPSCEKCGRMPMN